MASFGTLASARPLLPTMKKAILNFVQGLIPTSLYNSFQALLSPCCVITPSNIQVTCDGGIYTLTITLADASVYQVGIVSIGNTDLVIAPSSAYVVGNTLTFPNLDLSGIGGAGTYGVQLTLSTIASQGSSSVLLVSNLSNPMNVVFPAC